MSDFDDFVKQHAWGHHHNYYVVAREAWNAAVKAAAKVCRTWPLPHAPHNALANDIAEAINRLSTDR